MVNKDEPVVHPPGECTVCDERRDNEVIQKWIFKW